jgi:hypothetical protein
VRSGEEFFVMKEDIISVIVKRKFITFSVYRYCVSCANKLCQVLTLLWFTE